jgi:LysR family transcriptional regulator, glycine cleavage system transcriptional activator
MTLPDLESLRCFEAAAVVLNFRQAASAVGLSPAAFGDRVRRLEEQIGAPLFARTTRRVALTVAGHRLLPQARRLIDEARRCLEVGDGKPTPYELTVGTRFELGLSWLTPALGRLRRAREARTLHLYFGDADVLMSRLRLGQLDCAVSSSRLVGAGLRYELLHRESYALVARPALLERQPVRRATDTAQLTLLDLHPDLPLFRYFLDARPAGEAWDFREVEYLGTIGAVRHRALEGAGLAVLPHYFIDRDLAAGRLRQPLPRSTLQHDHFRLIWRGGHQREEEIRQLADELRQIPLA